MNEIYVAIIAATAGLAGAVIGSLSTFVITYINKRFDDRRQLRELAIKTAFDYWRSDHETAKFVGQLTHKNTSVASLDTYIVHMMKITDLISDRRLTAENVAAELSAIRDVSKQASESSKQ